MSKVFLDTNILVYAVDGGRPEKRQSAMAAIQRLKEGPDTAVTSTQVLQEFYVTVTKKLGVEPLTAKDMLGTLRRMEVVIVDPDLIADAVDCSILNRLSFWDALIVAAAARAKCQTLWSEDLNSGQAILGVRVQSPLS
jgi:predicted nucleic acid-binding protein